MLSDASAGFGNREYGPSVGTGDASDGPEDVRGLQKTIFTHGVKMA